MAHWSAPLRRQRQGRTRRLPGSVNLNRPLQSQRQRQKRPPKKKKQAAATNSNANSKVTSKAREPAGRRRYESQRRPCRRAGGPVQSQNLGERSFLGRL